MDRVMSLDKKTTMVTQNRFIGTCYFHATTWSPTRQIKKQLTDEESDMPSENGYVLLDEGEGPEKES